MVKDTGILTRQFSYKKGEVKLEFSLRVDIKQGLKDFKECLEEALKDVQAEIAKI